MTTHPADRPLLLIPTELERERLLALGGLPEPALCGFGPVAAAARTAQLLARERPTRVLLLGIAGSYDLDRLPLESAWSFQAAQLHGVGVGEGPGFIDPPTLGFPQWPGESFLGAIRSPRIDDRVQLRSLGAGPQQAGLLLTTCAASATPAQATERRRRAPDAEAEDMEGFAVAAACALFGVELTIVRGISNQVGDREAKRWRIQGALEAAHRLALTALADPAWNEPR